MKKKSKSKSLNYVRSLMNVSSLGKIFTASLIVLLFFAMFTSTRWYQKITPDKTKQKKISTTFEWVSVVLFFLLIFLLFIAENPVTKSGLVVVIMGVFVNFYMRINTNTQYVYK